MRFSFFLTSLIGLIGLHAPSASVEAAVQPNGLFADNVVLQQGIKVPIWGTGQAGEKVIVKFDGQEVSGVTGRDGTWLVHLAPLKAGGPHEMTIAGDNTITIKNVLVGEVWVCSGQSNMEWRVQSCSADDKSDAKSAPKNPMIRMFTVGQNPQETPTRTVKGAWIEAAPDKVPGFSAVGYFFAKELHDKMKVPVGMINTSWGGTRAEAWTSRPALRKLGPEYVKMVEDHEAAFAKNPQVAKNPNAPSTLYNGMVAPLLPYAIRGSIWYQGESNAGKAYAYKTLFPAMIENWREDWHMPKMPFYFVQLAPFTRVAKAPGDSDWAELRESQRLTARNLPATGMAVITDMGHESDIHPTPKKPVGQRLAWIALEDAYHEKMVSLKAPDLVKAEFGGGNATLWISSPALVARELVPTDERKNGGAAWRVKEGSSDGAEVLGFTVAGRDQKFFAAKAKIDKNRITVWSDQVPEPMEVRYGWANHPICNVFSAAGIPMTPFRTDDFRWITGPKEKK